MPEWSVRPFDVLLMRVLPFSPASEAVIYSLYNFGLKRGHGRRFSSSTKGGTACTYRCFSARTGTYALSLVKIRQFLNVMCGTQNLTRRLVAG